MIHLFRGRFDCKIDPKGRIKLPASYRTSLPEQDSTVVITNSQYQGQRCLEVCALLDWQNWEARVARMSPLQAEVQAYRRFYMASAQVVSGDAQDRFLIPQSLRQYARLSEAAVLVGMGGKFEIWAAEIWSSIYENMAENFHQTIEIVAALDKEELTGDSK